MIEGAMQKKQSNMAASMDEVMFLALAEDDEETALFLLESGALTQSGAGRVTYEPNFTRFSLETMTDDQCIDMFRFDHEKLNRLNTALEIPDKIVCQNRTVALGMDALCIFLRRLAYPNRLSDLERFFGRPKSTLSFIVKETVNFLHARFGHLLHNIDQPWLQGEMLHRYADAIHQRGAPLDNCIGFIDGTVRPMCRPTLNQRVCYNGHKRVHALKYQSIMLPNGIIANLYGPVEGRRHDCALLRMSGILDQFEARPLYSVNGQPFCLYGDPAYPIHDHLQGPFKGAHITEVQQLYNQRMSSVRECVEWGFGKTLTLWAFLDFKKNLKVMLQPIAKYYMAGALLTNCHTCLYGSETSDFFHLQPPSLEEYLH